MREGEQPKKRSKENHSARIHYPKIRILPNDHLETDREGDSSLVGIESEHQCSVCGLLLGAIHPGSQVAWGCSC